VAGVFSASADCALKLVGQLSPLVQTDRRRFDITLALRSNALKSLEVVLLLEELGRKLFPSVNLPVSS